MGDGQTQLMVLTRGHINQTSERYSGLRFQKIILMDGVTAVGTHVRGLALGLRQSVLMFEVRVRLG